LVPSRPIEPVTKGVNLHGDAAETLRALLPLLTHKADRRWQEEIAVQGPTAWRAGPASPDNRAQTSWRRSPSPRWQSHLPANLHGDAAETLRALLPLLTHKADRRWQEEIAVQVGKPLPIISKVSQFCISSHDGLVPSRPIEPVTKGADLRRAAEVLNAGKKVAILIGAGARGAAVEVVQIGPRKTAANHQ
jgi:thiamine pyrophosphate-dependent acetolactate synthase large subunit-like protein